MFESLQILKNIYKTDSVTSIAAALSNIGLCFGSLKGKTILLKCTWNSIKHLAKKLDYESEIKYQLEAVKVYKRLYEDADHPDVAASLNNIALAYGNLNDYKNELKYQIEALEMTKRYYKNVNHTSIAISLCTRFFLILNL